MRELFSQSPEVVTLHPRKRFRGHGVVARLFREKIAMRDGLQESLMFMTDEQREQADYEIERINDFLEHQIPLLSGKTN